MFSQDIPSQPLDSPSMGSASQARDASCSLAQVPLKALGSGHPMLGETAHCPLMPTSLPDLPGTGRSRISAAGRLAGEEKLGKSLPVC